MAGVKVGVGYVDIRPDLAGFGRELKQGVTRDITAAGQNAGATLKSQLSSAAKGAAASFGAAFAAIKVKDFLGGAIDAASDLSEAIGTSRQVFGAAQGEIDQWASTTAAALGLSRRAALEATAGFGNLFVQTGVTGAAAADMSKLLVGAAADLRAAFGGDIVAILDSMSASFRGEYDSLQRYIPLISAAAVEQAALAATGKTNAATLTQQEKAAAAYTFILENLGAAQGAAARESGNLASQQARTAAEWENTRAELGESLIPVMLEFSRVINDTVIPAFQTLFLMPGAEGEGWAASLRDLIGDTVGFVLGAFAELSRGVANFIGAIPGNIGSGLISNLRSTADAIDDSRTRLHASTSELLYWNEAADGATDAANRFGIAVAGSLPDIKKAALGTADNAKALRESTKASRDSEAAQRDYERAKRDLHELEEQGAVDAKKVAEAQQSLTDALRGTGHAQRELSKAQREYDQALAAAQILGTDTAQEDLADATDNLADAKDAAASADERAAEAQRKLSEAKAGDPDYQNKLADARDKVADANDRIATSSEKAAEKSEALAAGVQKVADAGKDMIATFSKPGVADEILGFMKGLEAGPTTIAPPRGSQFGEVTPEEWINRTRGWGGTTAETILGGPVAGPTAPKAVTINQTFNEKADPMLIGKAVAWQVR